MVVDENSFSINDETISISQNVEIGSITWLNKSHNGIQLNGNTITVRGNLIFGSEKAFISSTGKIILDGTLQAESKVLTTGNNFSAIDLEVNTNSKISMNGSMIAQSINLVAGNLNMSGSTISVTSLQVSGSAPKALTLTGSSISGFNELKLNSNALELMSDGALLTPANNSIMDLGNRLFNGKIRIVNQNISLLGNNTLKELEVSGKLQIRGNNTISSLKLNGNSSMIMDAGTMQTLTQTTQIISSADSRVVIDAPSGKSSIKFDGRYKLCFDYLDINNVDVTGDAIVNAGLSSTLMNSSNWAKDKCDDILFPDFDIVSNCANGIIQLVDKSGGLISNWFWTTSSTSATVIKETNKSGSVIFPQAGKFEISLRISNSNDSRVYKKSISVIDNDLPANEVILNGLNLFSTQSADLYEWYKNFDVIPNATGRSYPFNGEPGSYFILTKSNSCNRISNTVLITGVNEPLTPIANSVSIFPNPAENIITVTGLDNQATMKIMNVTGQVVYEAKVLSDEVIPVERWPRGIYIVTIMNNLSVVTKKIVLR